MRFSIILKFILINSLHNSIIIGLENEESKNISVMKVLYKTEFYKVFYNYLKSKGINKYYIPRLFCIAKFESNFNQYAININKNNTIDIGLLQINSIWYNQCNFPLYTTENNVSCAKLIIEKQGLKAWVAYKKFKYICEKSIQEHEMEKF